VARYSVLRVVAPERSPRGGHHATILTDLNGLLYQGTVLQHWP
jgi:hypothetical protein